ncbi:hypothetical protein [Methylococcus sp. Mc7]|uniref:hypothetical protein n=1 Tax=Methylococcus sp. Mc7 TaxID=2860258 RepID=UPI001C531E25|nr:hypothetical protein [Methylococcus sp. Mc7]QXP85475.1 hypothetical protein KW115_07130 [Methylococcus sp. Mc7]
MKSEVFELAKQAIASIEMYQQFYASSSPFHDRLRDILYTIRTTANRYTGGEKNFLLAFADALEIYAGSGEYKSLLNNLER